MQYKSTIVSVYPAAQPDSSLAPSNTAAVSRSTTGLTSLWNRVQDLAALATLEAHVRGRLSSTATTATCTIAQGYCCLTDYYVLHEYWG